MGGYGGNALRIDLTTGKIEKEPLDSELAQKYIGGFGLAQKLAYDYLPSNTNPWAPEAPIIICPGFLNGTPAPSACKVSMTTREPASGSVSTWIGSLHFGAKLKWAGYDSLVITGKAAKPVYLKIIDDDIEICSAENLWGKKDIHETVDILREKHGNSCSVAAIGPAAENLVKISMVFIDKSTTFGRAAGSTWGSKNLKAIVVDGTKGFKVDKTSKFMKAIDRLTAMAMQDPNRNKWKELTLYYIWPLWENSGYLTTKNFSQTAPKSMMLGPLGKEEYEKRKFRVFGCPACVAPDKAVLEIKGEKSKNALVPLSTSIDPAMALGGRLNISKLDDTLHLWNKLDRYGIDGMTFSGLVGWSIDLYQRGIITQKDTGGIELKEGFETARTLIELTRKNEGFGKIIAQGFKGAIKKIGKGSEKYACAIKGTEPDFDARAYLGVEVFSSVVNTRPSRDLPVGGLTIAKGRRPEFFKKVIPATGYLPEEKIDRILTPDGFDLPRLTAHYENWAAILDMFGICFRMQSSALYTVKTVAELYSAATGIEKPPQELLKDAERAVNLAKFLNVREGFARADDKFPDKWFEPLQRPDRDEELVMMDYFGKKQITREDSEDMLSDYYDEHGWDVEKGIPTKEKLIELGLEDAAREMGLLAS